MRGVQYLGRAVKHPAFACNALVRLMVFVPLISQMLWDRQRTRFMSRVRLPGNGGHCRRKQRQPFDVKFVLQTPVERGRNYRFEKCSIKEGQLEFYPMQIQILEVQSKLATLIIEHQEQIKV